MRCVVISNCAAFNGITFDFDMPTPGAPSGFVAAVDPPFGYYDAGSPTSGCQQPPLSDLVLTCLHGIAECADMGLPTPRPCMGIHFYIAAGLYDIYAENVSFWDDPGIIPWDGIYSALQRQGTSPQTWLTYTLSVVNPDILYGHVPCVRVTPDASAPYTVCTENPTTLQFLFTALA